MEKSVRQSNFELLRIICMLMIVAGHIIIQHGGDYNLHDSEFVIPNFIKGFLCVAVNTFILISGYWGIQFKVKKLMRMEFQVIFYSVLIFIIMTILGYHQIELKKDFFYFLPVITKRYWFVTCYITLFVISPFLNKIKTSLSISEYRRFLFGGFIIIYLWPTFNFLINAPNLIEDAGYGIVNFIYLYFLGDYIHRFFITDRSWIFYMALYLIFGLLLGIVQYLLSWILGFIFTSYISYNTLFILAASVSLFISFTKISFHSNWINKLAKPCLAVYLIHLHPLLWSFFCVLIGVKDFHGLSFLLLLFWLPIIIYLACFIIENIRLNCLDKFETFLIDKILHKK